MAAPDRAGSPAGIWSVFVFVGLGGILIAISTPSLLRSRRAADEAYARSAQARVAPVPAQASAALASMTAARKLIRTGSLTLEVADYAEAARRIAALAESFGGYLAESKAHRTEQEKQRGSITLRVPAERFPAAFAAVKALGKVRTENVSTQDVTKEYTDLETRLRVKRETEARLRDILRTQTAKLSDVLEAERELGRVTEGIEQMEGERRFYDQQVALSSLSVELYEPDTLVRPGSLAPIREALRDSMQVFATSASGLVYVIAFLTPWLGAGGLAWVLGRAVRPLRKPVPQPE